MRRRHKFIASEDNSGLQTPINDVQTAFYLFCIFFVLSVCVAYTNAESVNTTDENASEYKEIYPPAKLKWLGKDTFLCQHDQDIGNHQNPHHHRRKRFQKSRDKFHTMVALWHILKFSVKLPQDVQVSIFKEAFEQWHNASRLNFSYTTNAKEAHIKISFVSKFFNDGPGGTLGGAWGPDSYNARPGEIFMDEDENWCTDSSVNDTSKGANLLAVALHEIGHAIGLKHSKKNLTSIMHSVIRNNNTKLLEDDIAAIRSLYGKCEVRDLQAVMHDRYGANVDTLIVISNNKVWRIWADSGDIFYEKDETWPKDVRDYYKAKGPLYDAAFPIVDGFYAEGDNDVYLFGRSHFIRRQPIENDIMANVKNGRFYDFKEHLVQKKGRRNPRKRYWLPEGPLPYKRANSWNTPTAFKHLSRAQGKFGAAYEEGCCYWEHFFFKDEHMKVSLHDFNKWALEKMNVNFPGAPESPDAAWYDRVNLEWYFFKKDKYYKWDANAGNFTDRGPISLLWYTPCD